MAALEVPGYDVDGVIDGAPQAWRARRRADGRTVLLRVLPSAVAAEGHDQLRRTLARIGSLASESLLPLHTVMTTDTDLIVVYDYPAGGSLVTLLAARQRLTVGEVVSLGLGAAGALAEIHEAGLSHGDLSESSIYLRLDGLPMLTDVGLVAGQPADDVRALAGMCRRALGGGRRLAIGPAAGLAGELSAAEKRPDLEAADLASLLRSAAPPVPIRLGSAAPPPAVEPGDEPAAERDGPAGGTSAGPGSGVFDPPPATSTSLRGRVTGPAPASRRTWLGSVRPRSLPIRRTVITTLAAVSLLLLAVVLGLQWAKVGSSPAVKALPAPPTVAVRSTHPAAPRSSSRTPPPTMAAVPSWRAVLAGLDRRRAAAFAAQDPAALAAVDAPSSAALRTDRQTASELRRRGASPRGLRWDIVDLAVDSAGPPGVVLRVTDRMPAHELIGANGAVLASRPARADRAWRVTLLPGPGGWRFAEIAAV